jgi:hypothetical protein
MAMAVAQAAESCTKFLLLIAKPFVSERLNALKFILVAAMPRFGKEVIILRPRKGERKIKFKRMSHTKP